MIVVIDCSPSLALIQNDEIYHKWLDSLITFCNAHIMLDEKNQLTIIASYPGENRVIYPMNNGNPTNNTSEIIKVVSDDGQLDRFAHIAKIVKAGIESLIKSNQKNIQACLTKGLPTRECLLSGALGLALCRVNSAKPKLPARIIFLSCSMTSTSFSTQYMNLMNSFFAAQKMGVKIDACVYMMTSKKDESLSNHTILQQGCDLTNGLFLRIHDVGPLLEYLLWVFLPGANIRDNLLLPEKRKTTHRAACFCHRNIIEIGYVCSVCLSIFCRFSPICSTCQTHFKINLPHAAMKSVKIPDNINKQANK